MSQNLMPALKPKIEQGDLFLCDLTDTALKDDMASMEHPIFTISKKPDMQARVYKHNGNMLRISPSEYGIATMYDKDILIYAVSKVMQAKNKGEPISQNIIFEAHEALRFMHRTNKNGRAGGTEFRALEISLRRLKGTLIETDITTNGIRQWNLFGLVDSVTIHRKDMTSGRVLQWGLKLSDWLFNAIQGDDVLTLHPDYFRLRRPIEKRIYELARRHCGNQEKWNISLENLLKKIGSSSPKYEFRRVLRNIVENDHLPDYHISLNENDIIKFTPKEDSKLANNRKKKGGVLAGETYTVDHLESLLDEQAIGYTKYLAKDKNLDWYGLLSDFTELVNSKKEDRNNMSASFVGYVGKKKSNPRY